MKRSDWIWLGVTLGTVAVGCAVEVMPITRNYMAPDLFEGTVVAYVDEFYFHCHNPIAKPGFVVLTSRLPECADDNCSPTAAARTLGTPGGNIYIRLDHWLTLNDNQRKWLTWHELLHASFGLRDGQDGLMKGDGSSTKLAHTFTVDNDLKPLCERN